MAILSALGESTEHPSSAIPMMDVGYFLVLAPWPLKHRSIALTVAHASHAKNS